MKNNTHQSPQVPLGFHSYNKWLKMFLLPPPTTLEGFLIHDKVIPPQAFGKVSLTVNQHPVELLSGERHCVIQCLAQGQDTIGDTNLDHKTTFQWGVQPITTWLPNLRKKFQWSSVHNSTLSKKNYVFFNITLDNKNYLQYTSFRRVFRVNDTALAQKFVKDRISQYSCPLLQLDLELKEDIFTSMHKKITNYLI